MLSIQCDVIIDGARPVSLLVMTVSPAWQSYVRWGALTGRGTFWRTYIIMPKAHVPSVICKRQHIECSLSLPLLQQLILCCYLH